MNKLIVVAIALLAVSGTAAPSHAQDNSGWGALGEMLAGDVGTEGAYEDAYRDRVETEAAYWGAIRARQEAEKVEQQLKTAKLLEARWRDLGLPPDEARAVAFTFEYTPELAAIVARAKRDGSAKTFAAAGDAYRDYRYLLANQLLIAAFVAQKQEQEAVNMAGQR